MIHLPESEREKKRDTGSLALSIVLHVVIGAAILRVLMMPYPFFRNPAKGEAVRPERIGFLRLPQQKSSVTSAGQAGGNGREGKAVPQLKLVAPKVVPNGIPVPAVAKASREEGTGPLIAGGGPVRGITPSYSDPRLWRAPDNIVSAPKTATQRLDSAIVAAIQPYNDSIAAHAGDREPGDWTFEKNGQKFGMDRKFIHLGPVSIPNAILAMLPLNLNVSGNPVVADRERTLSALNSQIVSQAQRGMNDADFQKAVRSIRERKERERAALKSSDPGKKDSSQ